MTAVENHGALVRLSWGPAPDGIATASPLLLRTARELQEYFQGGRRAFTLPVAPEGTAFQQAVWRALLEIPCGTTVAYGELARNLGRPGAARAVGMACHSNPIAIVIPCHRVVGAHGALTGYAGGLVLKRRLLELECALPVN